MFITPLSHKPYSQQNSLNNNSSQNVAQYISYLLANSLWILAYKHIFSNPMLGQ
jgi:hypothetical protein